MKINHAILHVFDFVSCVNVYAQEELDLANKNAKRYVAGHAKRALGNIDSKRGEFAEGQPVRAGAARLLPRERDFAGLSVQIAEYLAENWAMRTSRVHRFARG